MTFAPKCIFDDILANTITLLLSRKYFLLFLTNLTMTLHTRTLFPQGDFDGFCYKTPSITISLLQVLRQKISLSKFAIQIKKV